MGKPNGKLDYTKAMVDSAVAGDSAPVTFKYFEQEIKKLSWVNEALAQQVISLDVAVGLLMESMRDFEVVPQEDGSSTVKITPWSAEKIASFKKEHQFRVEKMAKKIAEHSEELNRRIVV